MFDMFDKAMFDGTVFNDTQVPRVFYDEEDECFVVYNAMGDECARYECDSQARKRAKSVKSNKKSGKTVKKGTTHV